MSVSAVRVPQFIRFIQVGLLNTAVGYGLYATAVAIGLGMFEAQIVATILAMAFNYVSYSHYVFSDRRPSGYRFVFSYLLNYAVSVAALAMFARFVPSAYVAGLLATLATATINFGVLRRFVFVSDPGNTDASPKYVAGERKTRLTSDG